VVSRGALTENLDFFNLDMIIDDFLQIPNDYLINILNFLHIFGLLCPYLYQNEIKKMKKSKVKFMTLTWLEFMT
jgi:hypothetical protein